MFDSIVSTFEGPRKRRKRPSFEKDPFLGALDSKDRWTYRIKKPWLGRLGEDVVIKIEKSRSRGSKYHWSFYTPDEGVRQGSSSSLSDAKRSALHYLGTSLARAKRARRRV